MGFPITAQSPLRDLGSDIAQNSIFGTFHTYAISLLLSFLAVNILHHDSIVELAELEQFINSQQRR
jgi:hypothetical protein